MRQFFGNPRIFSSETLWRLVLAFMFLVIPVLLFVELAEEVREGEALLLDEQILQTINGYSSPLLDTLTVGFTQLGGVIGVVVLTTGIAALLWGRNKRRMAALLTLGVGGAVLLNLLLKAIFQRGRPELWERLVTENSYSFPSGHAMASSALAFSIVVICWPTRFRWVGVTLAVAYMLVIGLTRLYLGVHYPSDVIAGWAVSAAWVATMIYVLTYRTTLLKLFRKRQL